MLKTRELEKELEEAGWTKIKQRGKQQHHKFFKPGSHFILVPATSEIDELVANRIRTQAGLQPASRCRG